MIGRKKVGAAVVARAASQNFAGNAATEGKLLYVRIKTGVPAARVLVATTKVLQASGRGFSKGSWGSSLLPFNTFCICCSITRWSNFALGSLDLDVKMSFEKFL